MDTTANGRVFDHPNDHLKRVLELLYTAAERYSSMEGKIYSWTDQRIAAEARQDWLEMKSARGVLAVPMRDRSVGQEIGLTENTAHFSVGKLASSTTGRPLYINTLDSAYMPRPADKVGDIVCNVVGESTVADRRAIKVWATSRRQWHEVAHSQSWLNASGHELLVDTERGILLGATAYFRGKAFAGKEILSVSFDEPMPAQQARWERIGEVVNLLYTAQHNFSTVRASVRKWDQFGPNVKTGRATAREFRHRFWAANPARFGKEQLNHEGQSLGGSVYKGAVWWRYSPSRQSARTNASPADIPDSAHVTLDARPAMPEAAVYGIMDGEYGIIAEHSLNPSFLISGLRLEPVERTTFIGREAIRVQGNPTGENSGLWWWWEDADEYELLIDAARGTLLRLGVRRAGEEFAGHEVTELEFDSPIPDDMFTFTPPPGMRVTVRRAESGN